MGDVLQPPFMLDPLVDGMGEAWMSSDGAPLELHAHTTADSAMSTSLTAAHGHYALPVAWDTLHSMQQAFLDSAVDSSRWTSEHQFAAPHRQLEPKALTATGLVDCAPLSPTSTPHELAFVSQSAPVSHYLSPTSPTQPHFARAASDRRLSLDETELDDPTSPSSSSSAPKIKPFIAKLTHLVDNPDEFRDCIVWDDAGSSFIVCHASGRLLQEVLPKFFGHSNIHSFTRQLNVYGFTRMSQAELADKLATVSTGDYSGWSHPHFLRDDKSTLEQLTPKPSKARMLKKQEKLERLAREEARRREATHLLAQSRHGFRLPHKTGAAIGHLAPTQSFNSAHTWGYSLTPNQNLA
ncbi:hypothetical protein OIV83_000542 [Microbotryomycetes sp. JL201]|nr:hypothetical protein OIV83_000542 [Microbotryomycetes sp. JL201]